MAWNYQREEGGFKLIPEGAHRVRIVSAEKAQSKSGKDMLTLKFDVSNNSRQLYHYIVFLPDRPEITNRNLTQFFDSFKDIPEGDFNTANWIGKVGAVEVVHEDYNDKKTERIKYFIRKDKQADLPAWVEPPEGLRAKFADADKNAFMEVPDNEELPFM